jgi:hypothetical protein
MLLNVNEVLQIDVLLTKKTKLINLKEENKNNFISLTKI